MNVHLLRLRRSRCVTACRFAPALSSRKSAKEDTKRGWLPRDRYIGWGLCPLLLRPYGGKLPEGILQTGSDPVEQKGFL